MRNFIVIFIAVAALAFATAASASCPPGFPNCLAPDAPVPHGPYKLDRNGDCRASDGSAVFTWLCPPAPRPVCKTGVPCGNTCIPKGRVCLSY